MDKTNLGDRMKGCLCRMFGHKYKQHAYSCGLTDACYDVRSAIMLAMELDDEL